MKDLSRRRFLLAAGGAGVLAAGALALRHLAVKPGLTPASAGAGLELDVPVVDYSDFENIYRQKWQWDSVAKGTHFVNCWYQRGCNWNVYVKDGIVWREEQAGTYQPISAKIPDYNPRGCQKGACYSERMYDDGRLRHPLKRVGARGEGKWKRLSWDEALTEVADRTIDAMISEAGPASVVWDQGTGFAGGANGMAVMRAAMTLDTPILECNTEIGDHRPGVVVTTGKMSFCSSADDMFHSDLILIWGGNPFYTQIPNAHFMTEARYNGTRLVTIAPDYSASAIHADLWVPVAVGTDAALGLSMAQVMIDEGLYDRPFVQEQTDLPLLVRLDNGRFLREQDLEPGGAADAFYIYDQANGKVVRSDKDTLALQGIDPALEGEFEVDTVHGRIAVRPTFAKLKEHLRQYAPELATRICGTHPEMIRRLARELCQARAATCVTQSTFSKFYHGGEIERAQILCFSLAGQIGRKGAGYMAFPYLSPDGAEVLGALGSSSAGQVLGVNLPPKAAVVAMGIGILPELVKSRISGENMEQFTNRMAADHFAHQGAQASSVWNYFQGMDALYGRSAEWDPHLKRSLGSYMDEAVEKGWQFKPEAPGRVYFATGSNFLRRARGCQVMIDQVLPKLDLLVAVDWRMSTTGLYADYVFPAAAWYEKDDITWSTPLSPFAQVVTKAVEPMAEARSDWEFLCLLLKKIQQRAGERGLETFRDRHGVERGWDVYDKFTWGRRYTEDNVEDLLGVILELSTNTGEVTWAELKRTGFRRFTAIGERGYLTVGNATDVSENDTISCNTWHTEDKRPWPTLTRRIQFNIDHPFYEELGEVLPVHKDNPPMGGDYPLQLTGGHTRWSIHSSWIDQRHMVQLNRDMPWVLIGPDDAAARGIRDGDTVRMFNDIGACEVQARVGPAARPGQVVMYHAWELYQFKDRRSDHSLQPSPFNPIELAGGYFHLQARAGMNTPSSSDRGTRVEIARVD